MIHGHSFLHWAVGACAALVVWLFLDWVRDLIEQKIAGDGFPYFIPKAVHRLSDHRGDAFEVDIEDEINVPRAQSYAWFRLGDDAKLFKVRGVETFNNLGIEGMKRTSKTYIVVDEEVTAEAAKAVAEAYLEDISQAKA